MNKFPDKWFIIRNPDNHIEVNELISQFKGKKYTGTGVSKFYKADVFCNPPYMRNQHIHHHIRNGYTKLNVEQLRKLLRMENIIEKIPYYWHIVLTADNLDVVSRYYASRYPKAPSTILKEGYIVGNPTTTTDNSLAYDSKIQDYWVNEITTADFDHHILKKHDGYSVKKEFYIVAKTLNPIDDWEENNKILGLDFPRDSTTEKFYRSIGVLDVWFEKVSKREIKLPKINNYDGVIDGQFVKYGCAKLPIEWFKKSINRHITKLTLSSGVIITEAKMGEIRNYLDQM